MNPNNPKPTVLTTKELAARLGLKRHQLNYLIDSGSIPDAATRISGRRMFTEQEVRTIEQIVADRKRTNGKGVRQ